LVNKPDKPLDFMINALTAEPIRRVFLMGPTGSFRQDNALFLAEHFGWKCISTGDLLRKEVLKKNTAGIKIKDAFSKFEYVDDQIVIDLVSKEIQESEEEKTSWILQGFPRTKTQAMAL
jgi:adenylate kinase